MKNKILFLLASFVTLLLGPGAGHLIVKEWKKATLFISISLFLLVILSFKFVSSVGHETLSAIESFQNMDPLALMGTGGNASLEQFKEIFYKFKEENSTFMLMFNISFAALWAYAIYDLFNFMKKKEAEKTQSDLED